MGKVKAKKRYYTPIKIGNLIYTVKRVKMLIGKNSEGVNVYLNGKAEYRKLKIKLDDSVDPLLEIVIVWHEAIHAMLYHAGHPDHDENIVLSLGYALYNFVRDNPEFIKLTQNTEPLKE